MKKQFLHFFRIKQVFPVGAPGQSCINVSYYVVCTDSREMPQGSYVGTAVESALAAYKMAENLRAELIDHVN